MKAVCTSFSYIPAFLIVKAGLLSTWLVFSIGCRTPQSKLFHIYRNKFCFTGGYVETSVQLPGANNVLGLWPSIWAMGNLGRAGYGATLDGLVRDFKKDVL
jgi:hypothetical protein